MMETLKKAKRVKAVCSDEGVETIRRPRRVKTVCLDKDEEGIQLDEYLEKIHDNLYLSVANFCGEYLIHIRKYYLKDGCLKPKTEGCVFTVNQFAIFRDIRHDLEERSWALEEGMPIVEYENFVGTWRVTVDVFANVGIHKFYFNADKGQLVAVKKGISFPLGLFQSLVREINNLLTRFPSLASVQPCYKSLYTPLGGCEICRPFDKYIDNNDYANNIPVIVNGKLS